MLPGRAASIRARFAARPVTNGEYRAFVEDGGYGRRDAWCAQPDGSSGIKSFAFCLPWELRPMVIIEGEPTGTKIEVIVGDTDPNVDVVAALHQILNAGGSSPIPLPGQDEDAPRAFDVVASADLEAARRNVIDGRSAGAIHLRRDAQGDLAFDVYTKESALSRGVQLVRQAAISISVRSVSAIGGVFQGRRQCRCGIPAM